MTDTPETDSLVASINSDTDIVRHEHDFCEMTWLARRLERERNEAMALSEERYNYWQDSIKEYEEMRGKWSEACAELDQIKRVK